MKTLIVANWKMNPQTLQEARELFDSVKEGVKDVKNAEIIICPPFTFISNLKSEISNLKLGAQDCFWEEKGAFTGEVSPTILKDSGCEYVILGHSERRRHLGETDEMVNKKLKAVLKVGLKPILCIGSTERGKKGRKEMEIHLKGALAGMEKSEVMKIIFTYEPVWAISTTKGGEVATPENTKEGKVFIKEILAELFSEDVAREAKVIYGGSVDSQNVEGFIKAAEMDGVLIGAASLRPDDFVAAVKKVDLISKT
jgi:triosephosphate isomerase